MHIKIVEDYTNRMDGVIDCLIIFKPPYLLLAVYSLQHHGGGYVFNWSVLVGLLISDWSCTDTN